MRFIISLLLPIILVLTPAHAGTGIVGPGLVEGTVTYTAGGAAITLTKSSETVHAIFGSGAKPVNLPNATTLPVGRYFEVFNFSNQAQTVTSNAGSGTIVRTILPNDHSRFRISDNTTANGVWLVENVVLDISGSNVLGILPISKGGTNATTANAALNNLLPTQTGNASKVLGTNGTNTSWVDGGLSSKGQSEASSVVTTTLEAPEYQLTTTGTNTRLLETGNGNLLANASFEHTSPTTNWVFYNTVCTPETTEVDEGKKALNCAMTSVNGISMSQDITPTIKLVGKSLEYGASIRTTSANLQVCARQGGAVVGTCADVTGDGVYRYYPLYRQGPTSGSVGVSVQTKALTTGNYYVDAGYVGKARNVGTVAQAYKIGSVSNFGCTSAVVNTTVVDFPTGVGCTITTTGNVLAPPALYPGWGISSMAPGTLSFVAVGGFQKQSQTGGTVYFRVNDGAGKQSTNQNIILSQAQDVGAPVLAGSIDYPNGISTLTNFRFQGGASVASLGVSMFNFTVDVYYTPSVNSGTVAVNVGQLKAPTIQKFTTSGTYTPSPGVTNIKVRGVSGGGGGAGSTTGTAGGAGGTTSFGPLSATGGGGGIPGNSGSSGGVGGVGSLGGSYVGTSGSGASGASGMLATGSFVIGGSGGTSIFGGGALGPYNAAGQSAVANSGGGGGGGGTSATNANSGGGGGAGGYFDAVLGSNPGPVTVTIGAGGTAGTTGTNGYAGGTGGSGYVEVTEYYGFNMPLALGGVAISRDNPNGTTTINTIVNKSANYTMTLDDESLVMDSTGGVRAITLPAANTARGKKYRLSQKVSANYSTIGPTSGTICGYGGITIAGANDTIEVTADADNNNWISTDCRRSDYAAVNCQAASVVYTSSSGITGISNNASGVCQMTVKTGAYRSTPICSAVMINLSNGTLFSVGINGVNATRVDMVGMAQAGGSTSFQTNYNVSFNCLGER